MGQTLLTTYGQLVLYLVIIPGLLGSALVVVNHNTKQQIVNLFGFHAQIFGGCLGIIIHEFSHLIMAVIFGHKITGFRPLRIPNQNDPTDLSLGYVNHTWDQHRFYQQFGNLFIGIAPLIGNTLAILALTDWLLPELLASWSSFVETHSFLDVSLLSGAPFSGWSVLIWLILCSNICAGGFDLSRSDLTNAASGLIGLVLILIVVGGLIALIGLSLSGFKAVMVTIAFTMGFALLVSGVTNLLVRLLGKRKSPLRPRHLRS